MTWRFLVLIALVSTVFLGKETSVRAETVDRYGSLEKISPKLAQSLSAKDYFNRGLAKHVLGDNEGAIADYNEAIRLNLNYAEAYYNRGLAKSALGDKKGAIADYNETIRINPNFAIAYYNIACAYSLQNNLELALLNLQKAIQLSPELRQQAKTDKDFDNIRREARFQDLLR